MLIFLDLESTGFEKEDKICSIGALFFDQNFYVKKSYNIINEGKKIPSKASALHNITNEMVKKEPSFHESEIYALLEKENDIANTLIVHNKDFILSILENSGLKWHGKIVDTQRVVKHIIPECELFSLEFLRYELQLYKNEEMLMRKCGIKDAIIAHHALSDALIIKLLFEYLNEDVSLEKMFDLSFESVLLEKFPFGKYAGQYIEEIAMNDRNYLFWMLSLENLDDDLRYSLEYYLKG